MLVSLFSQAGLAPHGMTIDVSLGRRNAVKRDGRTVCDLELSQEGSHTQAPTHQGLFESRKGGGVDFEKRGALKIGRKQSARARAALPNSPLEFAPCFRTSSPRERLVLFSNAAQIPLLLCMYVQQQTGCVSSLLNNT